MRNYEIMMVLRPDLEEEEIKGIVERFVNIISENGGEVSAIDPWGKRRLAYEIQDFREGFYIIISYTAEGDFNNELERNFRIVESVIRHIIVRLE